MSQIVIRHATPEDAAALTRKLSAGISMMENSLLKQ